MLVPPAERARPRPDWEVRRLLWQLSLRPSRRPEDYPVAVVRHEWRLAVYAFATREPVRSARTYEIPRAGGHLRLRAYFPKRTTSPGALLWIHGGGFVAGDLFTAGATCRALANRSGAVVVSVDYRLAPEHHLALAQQDCIDALKWLHRRGADLGIDPRTIAIGGDSAGGGLAAICAHEAGRLGIPLAAQLLIYPALAPPAITGHAARKGPLTDDWVRWFIDRIAEAMDGEALELSMLDSDPPEAPPLILVTAGFDPLRDDALAYATRLAEAGRPVHLLHYPGQIHGFVTMDRVLIAARDALDRSGAALRAAFAGRLSSQISADLPRRRGLGATALNPRQRARELWVAGLWAGYRTTRHF